MRSPPGHAAVFLLSSLVAGLAHAQTPPRVSEAGHAEQPSPTPTIRAAPGEGVTVDGGPRYSLMLRPRVQLRDTVSERSEAWENALQVRRLRLELEGRVLSPQLTWALQFTFAPEEQGDPPLSLLDARLDYALHRDAQLRVGQFLVPFDRARNNREWALHGVERPLVISELALERDVGVTVGSKNLFGWGERLGYSAGIFAGGGLNRIGGEVPGFLYLARAAFRPFGGFNEDQEGDLERRRDPRLALGVAAAFNHRTDRTRSTHGPRFSTDADLRRSYRHGAVDAVFKWSGLYVLGQAMMRQGTGGDDATDALDQSAWGWLAQVGMMVAPLVEVTGRYNELRPFDESSPAYAQTLRATGREAGGGVNLYLNGHRFKLQADYMHRFGDGSAAPRNTARLQLDASF